MLWLIHTARESETGPGTVSLHIMPLTVHTRQGQRHGQGTGLGTNFPVPGPLQCV